MLGRIIVNSISVLVTLIIFTLIGSLVYAIIDVIRGKKK